MTKMEEDSSFDELWCEDCNLSHGLDCPKNGPPLKIHDRKVTKAIASLPKSLSIENLEGSRQIVAALPIARRTQFGPLEARRLDGDSSETVFKFKIFQGQSVRYCLDTRNENDCNWMSLVALSPDPNLQNLVSIQHHEDIYFLATRDIQPGEVFCAWYTPKYAARLMVGKHGRFTSKPNSAHVPTGGDQQILPQQNIAEHSNSFHVGHTKVLGLSKTEACSLVAGSLGIGEKYAFSCDGRIDKDIEGIPHKNACNVTQVSISPGKAYAETDVLAGCLLTNEDDDIYIQNEDNVSNASDTGAIDPSHVHGSLSENKSGITSRKYVQENMDDDTELDCSNVEKTKTPLQREQGSLIKCALCHLSFQDMRYHLTEEHNVSEDTVNCFLVPDHPCPFCSECFATPRGLHDHMMQMHERRDSAGLKCCRCSDTFKDFPSLQIHELCHPGVHTSVCPLCGRRVLKVNMDTHLGAEHPKESGFTCVLCEETFVSFVGLAEHTEDEGHLARVRKRNERTQTKTPRKRSRGTKETRNSGGSFKAIEEPEPGRKLHQKRQRAHRESREALLAKRPRAVSDEGRQGRRVRKHSKLFRSKNDMEVISSGLETKTEEVEVRAGLGVRIGPDSIKSKEQGSGVKTGNSSNKEDSKNKVFCHICDYHSNARVNVQEHILNEHKEVDAGIPEQFIHRCVDCGKVFLTQGRLTRHMQVHLPKQYKCLVCECTFAKRERLKSHKCRTNNAIKAKEMVKETNKKNMYACNVCDREFAEVKVRNVHLYTHFRNIPDRRGKSVLVEAPSMRDKTLTCSFCHFQFTHASAFHNHHRKVHKTDVLLCYICYTSFESHDLLSSHLTGHSEEANNQEKLQGILGKFCTCEYCFAIFPNQSIWKRHIAIHQGSKHFICDRCGKMFGRKDALEAHSRVHDRLQLHKCQICCKSFKSRRTLQVHMGVHMEARNYQCHVCLRGFKQMGNLNKHMTRCVSKCVT